MISVLVAADADDKPFWNTLRRVLESAYSTLFALRGELHTSPQPCEMAVSELQAFDRVEGGDVIVLFGGGHCAVPHKFQGGRAVAVVNSADENAVRCVSHSRLPAVTCGLSPRDTITLSSIGTDSAVINLQRTIECLDGSVAEPQEIPVRLEEPMDSFTLMALACIFILCGDILKLSGIRL